MADPAGLHDANVRRWKALDPLVSPPQPQPSAQAASRFEVVTSAGAGQGQVQVSMVTPADEASLWGPLRTHRLLFAVDSTDTAAAFDGLLDQFEAHVAEHATPGDADEGAMVSIPSRDATLAGPLFRHSFAPAVVVAVRTRDAGAPPPPASAPAVREAHPDELGELVALAVELHAYDAQFGAVSHRDTAAALLAASLRQQLQAAPGWTWVAEDAGEPVGIAQVQPSAQAGWISPVVAADPVAYLSMLYVRPDHRGTGTGLALADRAHAAVDDAGIQATLLHYTVPNPLSGPFWARQGYRPLWTSWQRRPAVKAP
jgi:GNAT superfamily N-acetyltransferase